MFNFNKLPHLVINFLLIVQAGGHENTDFGKQGDTIVYSCTQYGRPWSRQPIQAPAQSGTYMRMDYGV